MILYLCTCSNIPSSMHIHTSKAINTFVRDLWSTVTWNLLSKYIYCTTGSSSLFQRRNLVWHSYRALLHFRSSSLLVCVWERSIYDVCGLRIVRILVLYSIKTVWVFLHHRFFRKVLLVEPIHLFGILFQRSWLTMTGNQNLGNHKTQDRKWKRWEKSFCFDWEKFDNQLSIPSCSQSRDQKSEQQNH